MQYADAIYHVFDRGDRREPIFLDNEDRSLFLRTLAETCQRTGFLVDAYVLMKNHYHLELETPEPNLVDGMKWLQGTYTQRFNRRHNLVGHLYQGRYKAKPIEPDQPDYFRRVAEYIHLNPARGGLLQGPRADLGTYPWSSFGYFVGARRHLSDWLIPTKVFGSLGLADDRAGHRSFRNYLNGRAQEIISGSSDSTVRLETHLVEKSWYFGSDGFRQWLMEQVDKVVSGRRRESYAGPELVYHDEQAAQYWLSSGLQTLAMTLEQARGLPQSDPRKQYLAWLVKSRTVVGDRWLVDRLSMGHRCNISRAVSAFRSPVEPIRQRLKEALFTGGAGRRPGA